MGSIRHCSHCGSVFPGSTWCPCNSEKAISPPCPTDAGDVTTVFLLNDFPSPNVDLHQGPHKCKHCGSNTHHTQWCPNKVNGKSEDDFRVFKVTNLPQGPVSDAQQGEDVCQICGSNVHPTAWCYWKDRPGNFKSLGGDIVCDRCQKDKAECTCVRGPLPDFATPGGDFQIFKVTDLPEPPVDEKKPPRCAECGSLYHYGVFGCPEWVKKSDWNPGSKTEWLGMGSGQAGRRYRR